MSTPTVYNPKSRLARALEADAWKQRALCRGRGDVFFPEKNSDNRRPNKGNGDEICPICNRLGMCYFLPAERLAKSLCARCPVRRECMQAGMSEEYGIWAGTTREERIRARKKGQTAEEVLDEMNEQAVAHGLAVKEA